MRYFTLVLAAFFLVPSTRAQDYAIDKGSFLVSGSLNFSSSGSGRDDNRSTVLSINPDFSYFVTSGLAIGASASVSRFSSGDDSATSFGVGPRIAYYFGGPTSTLFPFVSAGVNYSDTEGLSALGADLAAGAVIMIARNVGLNGEAFYQTARFSRDDGSEFSRNSFGIRGGVTVFVF